MMKHTLQPFFRKTPALSVIAVFLVGSSVFSQENSEEKVLFVKANELVSSNPDESIKIANHLLKKQVSNDHEADLNVLLANSYIAKGDYNKSVAYIFEASENSENVGDSLSTEIAFVKAGLCRRLHLYKQMNGYLSQISQNISDFENRNYAASALVRIELEKVSAALEKKQNNQAADFVKEAGVKNKQINAVDYDKMQDILLAEGCVYKALNNIELSEKSFNDAFSYYKNQRKTSTIFEINILIGLAQLSYDKKSYNSAIDLLLLALPKAKKIENMPLQEILNHLLADNYLAIGDKELYQKYFDEFLTSNTSALDAENETVNSLYTLIGKEQQNNYEREEKSFQAFMYTGLCVLAVMVLSGLLLYRYNKAKRRRLKEIIGYLEVRDKLLVKPDADKKELKKISIPTETEQAILNKLKKFENSTRYTHKEMSLATLAAQLDINTKYLSETINKHYHENFNSYINRLRVNYIIEKIKNEPEYLNYKISYLAEESGFSSHSSFATVFKSVTGIAPTVFIDLIGKEVTQKKA